MPYQECPDLSDEDEKEDFKEDEESQVFYTTYS